MDSEAGLRVDLLGELRILVDGRAAELPQPRQRALLATLALHVPHPVSRAQLIDAVWGEDAPASAAGSLHTYVGSLRKLVDPDRRRWGPSGVVATTSSGYVLRVPVEAIDVTTFEHHRARARAATDPVSAYEALTAALALHRGSPLAGIPGPFAEAQRVRLEEARLTVVEEHAQLALTLGRAAEVVADLADALRQHPLRERLAGLLMEALYACGRKGEALAVFQDVRTVMVDMLGIDPGTALTGLHERILRDEPSSVAERTVPAQLPCDTSGFTGRAAELAVLHNARGVVSIEGVGGVGKTTLAVHFARQAASRFPDGQLYLDLRGFDPQQPPMTTTEALIHLLDGLGVGSAHVPATLDELVGKYRTLTARKRLLILLDNALSADQVGPLIPSGNGCLALVTSRRSLGGLVVRHGATRVLAGVLSAEDAAELLVTAAGISGSSDAIDKLALLCGRLPLALRIAAERVVGSSYLTFDALVDDLGAEQDRLDILAVADDLDSGVRAVFSWSYRALGDEAARLFRLLGLHGTAEVSRAAAAALAGLPERAVRAQLDLLCSSHLVEQVGRDRYHMHDLVRLYAAECCETDETREAALHRVLSWYLHTADAAGRALVPHRQRAPLPDHFGPAPLEFATKAAALQWFEAEHDNLVAMMRRAAACDHHRIAWQLPAAMWDFYFMRKYWYAWQNAQQLGYEAALASGDVFGEAWMLTNLGTSNLDLREFRTGLDYLQRSLQVSIELGYRWGEAVNRYGIGDAWLGLGDLTAALESYRHAERIFAELDDVWGLVLVRNSLGRTCTRLSWFDEAARHLGSALQVAERGGDRVGEGAVELSMGDLAEAQGDDEVAARSFARACAMWHDEGHVIGEARAQHRYAKVLQRMGEAERACVAWEEALRLLDMLGHPLADRVRAELARTRQGR